MPHAQPISFFSILSPAQYWVRSTNHLAPHYAACYMFRKVLPSKVVEKCQKHIVELFFFLKVIEKEGFT